MAKYTKPNFIQMPEGIVKYNPPYIKCDMLVGPCSCGAWHTEKEAIQVLLKDRDLTLAKEA